MFRRAPDNSSLETRSARTGISILGVEIGVVCLMLGLLGILILLGRNASTTFTPVEPISLDLVHLPGYAMLSLGRCLAAFVLSLLFTLAFGTLAASSRRASAVMMPMLDILQSIPVLSFLPALVLALVALVPGTRIGLELASIIMIFTGQAWNLTFGYHGALRSVPRSFEEVADLAGYGPLQRFLRFRLPTTVTPLVYNSMLSFAGGWFFLAVCEAFTLGNENYQLSGVGSYVALAVAGNDMEAVIAGLVAMALLVLATDQLIFRPLVAWADRFRMESTSSGESPRSWVYNLVRRSRLVSSVRRGMHGPRHAAEPKRPDPVAVERAARRWRLLGRASMVLLILASVSISLIGLWALLRLLVQVGWNPGGDLDHMARIGWVDIFTGFGLSFLRVLAALAIATIWTVPFGIWVGRSPRRFGRFSPIIQLAASYPAPLVFPVIVVWLTGLAVPLEVVVVLLLVFGAQWYVLFNVLAGGRSIPAPFEELSRLTGMGAMRRFRLVHLPVVLPSLTTGWITAAGAAWNATIVAEFIDLGADRAPDEVLGIGSIIARATEEGAYPALAAATVMMALGVVVINRLIWNPLERHARARYALA
jgi:NitT/TauT family transport system permease protein